MAGRGKRFIDAGYTVVKPLIEVDGKPMIEHVVNLFSPDDDFVFICNNDHLRDTHMREVLGRIAPHGLIVGIDYEKKGPIYGMLQALAQQDFLKDDEPVIVNYCDFGLHWDYEDFKRVVKERDCDGAIPCYIGAHPHNFGPDFYGYVRMDNDHNMIEVREKEPYTDNKMNEYAAAGMYYFKTGAMLKAYGKKLVALGIHTNGEHYAALPYNLMKQDGLTTYIYELPHFLQWGTPRDLEEYESWSQYFADKAGKEKGRTTLPERRERNPKLTLTPEAFAQCHDYWKACFHKLDFHPYTHEGES